jgi:hypothetical protein
MSNIAHIQLNLRILHIMHTQPNFLKVYLHFAHPNSILKGSRPMQNVTQVAGSKECLQKICSRVRGCVDTGCIDQSELDKCRNQQLLHNDRSRAQFCHTLAPIVGDTGK